MIVLDDPALEHQLSILAYWYRQTPGQLLRIYVQRSIDALCDSVPSLVEMLELP